MTPGDIASDDGLRADARRMIDKYAGGSSLDEIADNLANDEHDVSNLIEALQGMQNALFGLRQDLQAAQFEILAFKGETR